nr:MAG TPA: hypothetical protein [Herelleviridae sp.]
MKKYYIVCSVTCVGESFVRSGVILADVEDSTKMTVDDLHKIEEAFASQRLSKGQKLNGILNLIPLV